MEIPRHVYEERDCNHVVYQMGSTLLDTYTLCSLSFLVEVVFTLCPSQPSIHSASQDTTQPLYTFLPQDLVNVLLQ